MLLLPAGKDGQHQYSNLIEAWMNICNLKLSFHTVSNCIGIKGGSDAQIVWISWESSKEERKLERCGSDWCAHLDA